MEQRGLKLIVPQSVLRAYVRRDLEHLGITGEIDLGQIIFAWLIYLMVPLLVALFLPAPYSLAPFAAFVIILFQLERDSFKPIYLGAMLAALVAIRLLLPSMGIPIILLGSIGILVFGQLEFPHVRVCEGCGVRREKEGECIDCGGKVARKRLDPEMLGGMVTPALDKLEVVIKILEDDAYGDASTLGLDGLREMAGRIRGDPGNRRHLHLLGKLSAELELAKGRIARQSIANIEEDLRRTEARLREIEGDGTVQISGREISAGLDRIRHIRDLLGQEKIEEAKNATGELVDKVGKLADSIEEIRAVASRIDGTVKRLESAGGEIRDNTARRLEMELESCRALLKSGRTGEVGPRLDRIEGELGRLLREREAARRVEERRSRMERALAGLEKEGIDSPDLGTKLNQAGILISRGDVEGADEILSSMEFEIASRSDRDVAEVGERAGELLDRIESLGRADPSLDLATLRQSLGEAEKLARQGESGSARELLATCAARIEELETDLRELSLLAERAEDLARRGREVELFAPETAEKGSSRLRGARRSIDARDKEGARRQLDSIENTIAEAEARKPRREEVVERVGSLRSEAESITTMARRLDEILGSNFQVTLGDLITRIEGAGEPASGVIPDMAALSELERYAATARSRLSSKLQMATELGELRDRYRTLVDGGAKPDGDIAGRLDSVALALKEGRDLVARNTLQECSKSIVGWESRKEEMIGKIQREVERAESEIRSLGYGEGAGNHIEEAREALRDSDVRRARTSLEYVREDLAEAGKLALEIGKLSSRRDGLVGRIEGLKSRSIRTEDLEKMVVGINRLIDAGKLWEAEQEITRLGQSMAGRETESREVLEAVDEIIKLDGKIYLEDVGDLTVRGQFGEAMALVAEKRRLVARKREIREDLDEVNSKLAKLVDQLVSERIGSEEYSMADSVLRERERELISEVGEIEARLYPRKVEDEDPDLPVF